MNGRVTRGRVEDVGGEERKENTYGSNEQVNSISLVLFDGFERVTSTFFDVVVFVFFTRRDNCTEGLAVRIGNQFSI